MECVVELTSPSLDTDHIYQCATCQSQFDPGDVREVFFANDVAYEQLRGELEAVKTELQEKIEAATYYENQSMKHKLLIVSCERAFIKAKALLERAASICGDTSGAFVEAAKDFSQLRLEIHSELDDIMDQMGTEMGVLVPDSHIAGSSGTEGVRPLARSPSRRTFATTSTFTTPTHRAAGIIFPIPNDSPFMATEPPSSPTVTNRGSFLTPLPSQTEIPNTRRQPLRRGGSTTDGGSQLVADNEKPNQPIVTPNIPHCPQGPDHDWSTRGSNGTNRRYKCKKCDYVAKEEKSQQSFDGRMVAVWVPTRESTAPSR